MVVVVEVLVMVQESAHCCPLFSAVCYSYFTLVANKAHHQIEITSCTALLSINERSGVPNHIMEVGRSACLQLVEHYVT